MWITKRLVKSSKRKQKLYEKFLKKEATKMRNSTKHIKAYLINMNYDERNGLEDQSKRKHFS